MANSPTGQQMQTRQWIWYSIPTHTNTL